MIDSSDRDPNNSAHEDFSAWAEELGYPLVGDPGSRVDESIDESSPMDALEWQKWAGAPAVIPSGGIEGLLEQKLQDEAGLDPTEVDFEAIMDGFEWKANFSTDHHSSEFERGLDMINGLRDQHGIFNVVVSLAVKDPETGRLRRTPGQVAIFVRKDAEGTDR